MAPNNCHVDDTNFLHTTDWLREGKVNIISSTELWSREKISLFFKQQTKTGSWTLKWGEQQEVVKKKKKVKFGATQYLQYIFVNFDLTSAGRFHCSGSWPCSRRASWCCSAPRSALPASHERDPPLKRGKEERRGNDGGWVTARWRKEQQILWGIKKKKKKSKNAAGQEE